MLHKTPILLVTLSLAAPAQAATRVPARDHADGRVTVGDRSFDDRSAFLTSDLFRAGGYRCGTVPAEAQALAPSDCTMQQTVLRDEYAPADLLVIPVVFHLIERSDGVGHVPDEAVFSQIEVLNEDFRALPGTPGEGGADARVAFVLAAVDPQGNPSSGIDRHVNDDWFEDPGIDAPWNAMKAALVWDPTRYLNVYVNDAGGGLLGYAMFPQFFAGHEQDGVVLHWQSVGRDSPGWPYDQGRTATHEIGHYLGLDHTFGNGCGDPARPYHTGDLIADTAPEREAHFECVATASSCPGAGMDPIHNFMDYTDDRCMTHFTAEQVNRMRCALMSYRATLYRVDAPPSAAFTWEASDLAVSFHDASADDGGAIVDWRWELGDGASASEPNPVHEFAAPGVYEVRLTVTDAFGQQATTTATVVVEEAGGGCAVARGRGRVAGAPLLLFAAGALALARRRRRTDATAGTAARPGPGRATRAAARPRSAPRG